MKISFDISQCSNQKAGCGVYAKSLIDSMLEIDQQNYYFLQASFGDRYFESNFDLNHEIYSRSNSSITNLFSSADQAFSYWQSPNLEDRLGFPDIIHSNNFWCPDKLTSSKLIYTLYDLSFIENPNWTTEHNRINCLNNVYKASILADFIITISNQSKNHFLELFPHFPSSRIQVVSPGSRFNIAENHARPKIAEFLKPNNFWLSVGTVEPRKNYFMLLKAYALYLKKTIHPMPLVIIGKNGWLMDDFERKISELQLNEHVFHINYVSDDELHWFYRNCFVNLFPSLFEGFGLPVLESISLGAATVASDLPSLKEIGGSELIYLNSDDENAWANMMLKLSMDNQYKNSLADRGLKRSKCFSWQLSANQLLNLYKETLDSPRKRINSY
jgi:glycosyltransferase involved in cell wall biosynthesis